MSMGDIAVRNCKTHGRYTFDTSVDGVNKPCPKCKDIKKGMDNMKNQLQKAIDQIGKDAVSKAIPVGSRIGICDLHGAYMVNQASEMVCPICPSLPNANGTDATQVEHYIDMTPVQGTNPQQRINPMGV